MKKSIAAIAVLFFMLSLATVENYAATLTVTNKNDIGAGSLRQSIIDAVSGDTIDFAANVRGTIVLTAKIRFSKSLIIVGPGAGLLSITKGAQSPPGIFDVAGNSGGALNLSKITLTGSGAEFQGGAVSSIGGAVKLSNCVLIGNGGTENSHTQNGGAVYVSGATLTIDHCLISNNKATFGGGISMEAGSINDSIVSGNVAFNTGGGAEIFGAVAITNTSFLGNSTESQGGGVYVGFGGSLNLLNSTIANNVANGSEIPAVAPRGAGLMLGFGNILIINSTISGNRCGPNLPQTTIIRQGGGIYKSQGALLTLVNSTITGNSAMHGGGIRTEVFNLPILRNTIVAENFAVSVNGGLPLREIAGQAISQGNNLIGDNTGLVMTAQTGDQIGTNNSPIFPRLGSLANNGGATYTHSLLSTSPAINAGNNNNSPATDQRGVARPQGGTTDIGSYESGVISPPFGKIVFESTQDGNREIYSMNADFTNQTRLTDDLADDRSPKWSPDGTKILFQSNRDGSFSEIYTMNADGSNPVRLTINSIQDQYPDWSPDGSKIVFVRGNSLPSEIWTMDANGLNQVQITGSSANSLLGETEPSWSPDGLRIAFSANPNSGQGPEIYTMNTDGTNQNRLTFDPATDSYPVWSPDGNSIAYTNDSSGAHTNLLDVASLNIQIVSNPNNPFAYAPAWSPDGTKLTHYNSLGNIYIIDAGGENGLMTFAPSNLVPEGIVVAPQLDWFGFNTGTGTNVTANLGTTSITFSGISNPGTTTVVPIDPTTAGNVPSGYSLGAGFPAFEITTTATFTAPITVCVQVPSVTDVVTFNRLTFFHNEGEILVDRTSSRNFATKTICANVSSLSPFVVARSLAPTAANVIVSGRVSASNGRGISRVRMSITNQNGEIRFTSTNSFGFYRFTELFAGETYIIGASHKRYQFNSRVITVSEDLSGIDFTAEP
jgi:Tol biopolymer transport system component